MTIPLDAGSPRRLKLPTRTSGPRRPCGRPREVPIRHCSRWGLPCRSGCPSRGALLPHRFTLTPADDPSANLRSAGRTVFCGAFPGVAPAGRYPAPLPCGVRTFLGPSGPRPSGPPCANANIAAAPVASSTAGECTPGARPRTPIAEPPISHPVRPRGPDRRTYRGRPQGDRPAIRAEPLPGAWARCPGAARGPPEIADRRPSALPPLSPRNGRDRCASSSSSSTTAANA